MLRRLQALLWLALTACGLVLTCATAQAAQPAVKVGVLANSGVPRCLEQWSPTVQYLNEKILGHAFSLVCLEFGEVGQAVRHGRVDFLLANPSIATELAGLGVSPIATIKKPGSYSVFAGVIFCRADRADIASLADLKGKTFMAVDPQSFGGWRMAWRELRQAGLDPLKDFRQLRFGGYQESVPLAVLAGEVDAGTARSGVLERLERAGQLKISDLRILNPRISDQLPLLHSTRLYPEWPLSRLGHTSAELAEKVAVALLSMPADAQASRAAGHAGWTTPENYLPVRDLLRELRLGPYQDLGEFTLEDVLQRYWPMLSVSALLFLSMALSTALALRLNRKIRLAHQATLAEMERRRQAEQERERLLGELQAALANVKKLSGLLPICAGCKRIRDDQGQWQRLEKYLEQKSEAQFSHGICPECAARLYPDLFKKK
ncbi:MAG: phosphate/phosphite/phosphonate ABC transporter substrate-binding protein [Desulfarculus sp.]|nr:phosphate/phosphite/phosphonate ABC transporter substrate-binding protein [Desulfarculus sp.]